jgi:hypothetical protein
MDRYFTTLATAADSPEMLSLYEEEESPGNPSVLFTRRNDAFDSMQREGMDVRIFLCRERSTGTIVGMGACSINMCFVNGMPRRVAYLFGLKSHRDFRHKAGHMIPVIYEQLRSYLYNQKIDCTVTTILSENLPARRLLTRAHHGMPRYQLLGRYEVYALKTSSTIRPRLPECITCAPAGAVDKARLGEFFLTQGRKMNFFPVVHESAILPENFADQCLIVSDNNTGNILAACFCWDQRRYKQYIVHSYKGFLRYVQLFSPLLCRCGFPPLPQPGMTMNFVTLSFVCIRDQRPEYFRWLLDGASRHCAHYDFMLAGIGPAHPHRDLLHSRPHWGYSSDVYAVTWNGMPSDSTQEFGLPSHLECGRL